MRYGFLLTGEFPELGYVELLNLLDSYSEFEIVYQEPRIVIVESSLLGKKFFSRLAMTKEVFVHRKSLELEDIEGYFHEIAGEFRGRSICVRVKKLIKHQIKSTELERRLGEILWQKGAKIDLENPQIVIRVYVSEKFHVGVLEYVTDTKQFLERRPDRKPFFRPGALKPRFGRALVNLTGIRKGILLDPMCGTGTILIEAGLMGIDFCGAEAFPKIAYGCATNLRYYNLPVNLLLGDVKKLPFVDSSFDAVVTDYPYLRSSKSFGKLEELYEKSIFEIDRVLKPGKKAVLVSNIDLEDLFDGFSLMAKLTQRVHRSLHRRVYLIRKIG
jgi:tRNA (guanine10-N2)-dimethyltransferase